MENNDNTMRNHPPQPPQPPQQENEQLRNFWIQQMQEIESVNDFKTHQLPLSRIKKIMKSDQDVRMISGEAPVFFAKACEMFIVDLTMRSWLHAEENKRRTLHKSDISEAVARTFTLDFLLDVVPKDEPLSPDPGFMAMPHLNGGVVPYYYYPPPEIVIGTPVADGIGIYAAQQPTWPGTWTAPPDGDGEDEAEHNGGNGGGK